MLVRSFDFIALNFSQHQLTQEKGFCSVPPLCIIFSPCFILFTSHSKHRLYLQLHLVTLKHPFVGLCSNIFARILEMVVKCHRFCMHCVPFIRQRCQEDIAMCTRPLAQILPETNLISEPLYFGK